MKKNLSELSDNISRFQDYLSNIKNKENKQFDWYPYNTLANFGIIKDLLVNAKLESLFNNLPYHRRILDIGCADGDLAFFMESIGFKVDVLDHVETNFNDLKGLDLLKRKLKSSVNILQQDIDNNFTLIEDYSVTFALGILYHLRNPFNFLNNLCLNSEYVFLSTRIASHTPDGIHIRDIPVSYLLSKDELNNDPTNYWIFTLSCIRRLITRSGFKILSDIQLGRVNDSTPNTLANDERYFALLKRKENFVDIFNHHHF